MTIQVEREAEVRVVTESCDSSGRERVRSESCGSCGCLFVYESSSRQE